MKTHYKIQGTPNSPVLVFSNSLGSDLGMWDEVVPHLLPFFRVLRYDTRGHGGSIEPSKEVTSSYLLTSGGSIEASEEVTSSYLLTSGYTMDLLGQDVIDLLDQIGIESAHFCGLSMGGLIGQWLGIHRPERLKKLVISNTAAKIGDPDSYRERWNARIETIQKQGMNAIVDATMERWFTEGFRNHHPERVAEMKAMFLRSDVQGYAHCCAAIRDADFRETLQQIPVETLVIAGSEDPVTNVEQAEFLAKNIPDARLKILPARHLSGTELPEVFAETLLDFLVGTTPQKRGMHVRRTVLGDTHVDKANHQINPFNADFQRFITNYAWGEIWSRPDMSKHDRSLVTLAMLIALNRKAEFQMHVKAAFNNGVTVAEIKEVILQSAIYCGLPAANEAIHAAGEVFKELGIEI